MRKILILSVLAVAVGVLAVAPLASAREFGTLWYNGEQLRTFGVPAATPHGGIDPLYRIPGSGGVTAVAPGAPGYHGGAWEVWDATWNVTPYPLTSAQDVLAAADNGDITMTRNAEADFRCPVQP